MMYLNEIKRHILVLKLRFFIVMELIVCIEIAKEMKEFLTNLFDFIQKMDSCFNKKIVIKFITK